MHYSEIEMAESMSASTKISARNPVCRLCGGSHESRYMLRIFSKAGLSKYLHSKVYKMCGINIFEDDTRSAVLYVRVVLILLQDCKLLTKQNYLNKSRQVSSQVSSLLRSVLVTH